MWFPQHWLIEQSTTHLDTSNTEKKRQTTENILYIPDAQQSNNADVFTLYLF